jgi:hypothetical protein
MSTPIPASGRRTVLKRGVFAAAAAAAAALAIRPQEQRPALATVPIGAGQTIQLFGRGWHADTNTVPSKGDSYSVYGELLTSPEGDKCGEFYAACLAIDSPFQVTGEGVGSLEIHTLVLAGGSIVAMGAGGGVERSFAIVGGTGKYTGARGSYTATQDTYGLGGRGTAALRLKLLE